MKYIALLLLLLTSALSFGQDNERIKALRTAHITEALELTSAEAEKFWPVFNAFDERMRKLRRSERRDILQFRKGDFESLSESEAKELVQKSIQYKEKELENFKQLVADLDGIIPSQKILRLRRAEEEFKRKMIDVLKKRRGMRGKNR